MHDRPSWRSMPETCPCPQHIIFVWDSAMGLVDTGRHLERFLNSHLTAYKLLAGSVGHPTLGNSKANVVRRALVTLNPVRNHAQRQRLYLRLSFQLGDPIREHAGKALDLGDPAAIFFSIENDLELHGKPPGNPIITKSTRSLLLPLPPHTIL